MPDEVVTTVAIADIVPCHHKKNLGDISELVESIRQHGLQEPIVITPTYRVVDGMKRLEACKQLGWTTIPARIVSERQLRSELQAITRRLRRAAWKRDLTVLEKAELMVRSKQIYEALCLESKIDCRNTAAVLRRLERRLLQ